ncbi:MAG: phenylpyruvate tautomerase MIF-related protein [Oscillospiraceae bacterium]
MPFINVMTNVPVENSKKEQIKSALGEAITAIPGKSESWLMVGINPEYPLWFKGDNAPCAMVEVSVFGSASPANYEKLTGMICNILKDEINISPSRIYVKYTETSNWGWNGGNF